MGRPPNPPCSPRLLRMFTTLFMVVALLQTLAVRPVHAQNDPIFLWCSGDANYTATGQFKRNLDLLLTNLSTVPSTAARGHFQSASLGGTDGAAYGLAQCRADVLPEDCAACLNRTASEIVPRCPLRPVAAIRYDDCLLRYSDRPVLRIMEDGQQVILGNPQNTSDPSVFDQRLTELVTEITSEAAAAEGSSRFAVGIRNYSEFGDIYGLAQCTRDLLRGSCDRCLRDLTGNLPRGKIGGQVIAVSCMLRFETTPFFSLSILPPTSPPPLQNAPSPSPEEGGGNGTGGSPGSEGKKSNKSRAIIIAVMSVVAAALFLFGIVICLRKRRPIKRAVYDPHEQHIRSPESLLFDLGTLRTATGNFSDANKLGEGGFGPVYKGILQDGQQIAVKRLSMRSIQGLAELRNEVVFVAKLQHRNLVRLLGFCLEEEEKMVVYEYLPNTSLDKFLFDPVKQLLLDWERRYKLIEGIARGLVYLHEDSRLRIIHRDLKASNILLDEHMNPKISDFGLAKLCGVDDTHGNTSRIAGTFGYMAPEYAMHGQFSTKSDVFSFGVLALEIVTGRKNGTFHYSENAIELLNDVWHHWNEGTALRLLNPAVERYQTHEVLRCIHIGLLCIQDDPSERPNMSEVVVMLSSSSLTLPAPSKPAFIIGGSETSNSDVHLRDTNSARSKNVSSSRDRSHPSVQSANEVTISDVDAR